MKYLTLNTFMHTFISDYKRREQNDKQSEFSHGKLQSTNTLLPTTVSGKNLPSWWPQKTLKQKYLQHSYGMPFVFLASCSHSSSSPTAATHTTL